MLLVSAVVLSVDANWSFLEISASVLFRHNMATAFLGLLHSIRLHILGGLLSDESMERYHWLISLSLYCFLSSGDDLGIDIYSLDEE